VILEHPKSTKEQSSDVHSWRDSWGGVGGGGGAHSLGGNRIEVNPHSGSARFCFSSKFSNRDASSRISNKVLNLQRDESCAHDAEQRFSCVGPKWQATQRRLLAGDRPWFLSMASEIVLHTHQAWGSQQEVNSQAIGLQGGGGVVRVLYLNPDPIPCPKP